MKTVSVVHPLANATAAFQSTYGDHQQLLRVRADPGCGSRSRTLASFRGALSGDHERGPTLPDVLRLYDTVAHSRDPLHEIETGPFFAPQLYLRAHDRAWNPSHGMTHAEPKLRLRIEFDGKHTLGPGKVRLLEGVQELGSISAAARSMGMSYRHAWELLDDVNRCFDGRVFETEAGGRAGGGARVTDFGRELIARYHAMRAKAREVLEPDLQAMERSRTP